MLDFSKPLIIPSEAEINILKESYLFACKKDVEVIKPGNVSINQLILIQQLKIILLAQLIVVMHYF